MAINQSVIENIKSRVAALLGGVLNGKKWSDVIHDPQLTESVHRIIVEELVGSDTSTIGKALLQAISDDKLDENDLKEIVKKWALAQTAGDVIAQELISDLDDGTLTPDEISKLVLHWTKRQVKDSAISTFLSLVVAADGTFTIDIAKAKAMLISYFKAKSGLPPEVADPIAEALGNGKLDTQAVLAILAGWAAASDQERLSELLTRLKNEGKDTSDVPMVILSWLSGVDTDSLTTALKLLEKGDFINLLVLILGALDPNFAGSSLQLLLTGDIKELIEKELTAALVHLHVDNATDLVKALEELAKGTRLIFARPEAAKLSFGDVAGAVSVWHEIQEIIFYAQLFVGTGLSAIVSTDPAAKPHILEAAEITEDTPISKFVKDPSKQSQREEMANVLTKMVRVHFGDRLKPIGALLFAQEFFVTGTVKNGGSFASIIFAKLKDPL